MARARKRRLRFAAIGIAALFVGLPFFLVLPLRWLDPPTTAVLVARTHQRAEQKKPAPSRRVVPIEKISPHLVRAVLASEDDAFYLHRGFDFAQLEKAFLERDRKAIRGASTISQQTAKNLWLWSGRSY